MTVSIATRVRSIIADELGVDSDDLHRDVTFANLGATDIQLLHIGMSMEDIADAEASDDELERCKTVGQLISLAERLAIGTEATA